MADQILKLALPTGNLRETVANLLVQSDIKVPGYESGSRVLSATAEDTGIRFRIFREGDIPIQVALGNYDIGLCSDINLAEIQVRFPLERITRIAALPSPVTEVWLAASPFSGLSAGEIPYGVDLSGVRIASEYPNFVDLLAAHLQIPKYMSLPLYGAAEAYPPEDADLIILSVKNRSEIENLGLIPLHCLYVGGLSLIGNSKTFSRSNLSSFIERLAPKFQNFEPRPSLPTSTVSKRIVMGERDTKVLRLALPDGHAQKHTVAALSEAGITYDGYRVDGFVRRPNSERRDLEIKVVRPQDMPQLVAAGSFDLAITGVDWLKEHLAKFPSSPVSMAVDLGRSRYSIGPVVHNDFPADTTAQALEIWSNLKRPIRIASEYPALAEAFAREIQIPRTGIIPINGASEAFVPEDADILIEGTETGTSLRANNLKMLDPFLISTNCLISRNSPITECLGLQKEIIEILNVAAEQNSVT